MTTTAATAEAVQQTLAEYERLAISTGEWNGTDAPEFSDDGQTWTNAWLPNPDHEHPALARATVYRKGVERPIVVVCRWDEALPAVEPWRGLWLAKPIALFGAFTVRASLRRGFRDVIGDRREPDETIDAPTAPAAAPEPADRDWIAELAETDTEDGVRTLHREAKAARAVTVELEREIRKRLLAIQGRGIGGALVEASSRPAPGSPLAKLAEGGIVKPGPVIAEPEAVERTVPLPKPKVTVSATPADIARALAKLPKPTATPPRGKGGRRPQKPKARGPRD